MPSAVLAELYRGNATDAAIDTVLSRRGMRTITSGRRILRIAGALRYRDRLDSSQVVDCIVVATAIRLGGGVIATADPTDMQQLARDHPNVVIRPISG